MTETVSAGLDKLKSMLNRADGSVATTPAPTVATVAASPSPAPTASPAIAPAPAPTVVPPSQPVAGLPSLEELIKVVLQSLIRQKIMWSPAMVYQLAKDTGLASGMPKEACYDLASNVCNWAEATLGETWRTTGK